MSTDQLLIVIAISAYIMSTLAFFTYFLSRDRLPKLIGIPFAFIGCGVQFFELVYRFQTSHIWPLTNLYGSLSLFAAMAVAIFIGFAIKYDIWFIGGFVEALSASFLAYALTWNEGYLPAVPALQSYWIKIHVPLVVTSYAAFMVAAVTSVLYLIKYYGEKSLERSEARGVTVRGAAAAGMSGAVQMQAYSEPAPRRMVGGDSPALASQAAAGSPLAPLARDVAVTRQTRHSHVSHRGGRPAASHRRYHHGRLVGERGVGRVLAMGSEGDGGTRFVDGLRALHAPAHAQLMARAPLRLDVGSRLYLDHVLLSRRQYLGERTA